MWKNAMSKQFSVATPPHYKSGWNKYLLPLLAVMLLSACSSSRTVANCTSVTCRPQPDGRQLVIWWQPDLRNGPADFSRVPVND
ncbi:hypothetical protein Bresa_01986|uniref:Type III secretion protein HrpT n=2 Tax=Brenneria salicis TaxID=55214 RepID=A0A366I8I5_9GAMM|nr:hypothetical protein [Brenneria salicis ATCC 15712 = DSM 30166]RBP65836.1 hypothetical protein DES54_104101 [Brenneria salicis ATCC 15712 = DSM 30166]